MQEGVSFITYCDRYSGFLTIHMKASTDFKHTTKFLRGQLEKFGVPCVVERDRGPPFNSGEWHKFLYRWGIRHRLSSAQLN